MVLRHVLAIIVAAALVDLAYWAIFSSEPVVATLSQADRADLYSQGIIVAAGLLGFFITAVSILVSLDARRKIVEELQRGESFRLLVVNMLATVALLFILTLIGIVASVAEVDKSASHLFDRLYEWLALATVFELCLSGTLFGFLTYKVASRS